MNSVTLSNGNAVKLSNGMRFADFLKHNAISDVETGGLLFDEAKRIHAAETMDSLLKKQVAAVNSKKSVKYKGGRFVKSVSVTFADQICDEKDSDDIRLWVTAKRKSAEAAAEKARIYLAQFNKAPGITSNTSEQRNEP